MVQMSFRAVEAIDMRHRARAEATEHVPRLSTRYPVAGADVRLLVETKSRFGRLRTEPVAGVVQDLSVTGALIEVEGEVELVIGQQLRFSMREQNGVASVRHVSSRGTVTLVGVSFSSLSPTLEEAIFGGIAKIRSNGAVERHWELNR